ncbi:MAG TPA: DNA-3-methyladenine glycosylase [Candidatus Lustribacter sp.]|nr:DNA-3-methyladenine glycosylase [Candidatus Lustribacter sp.]
MTRRLPRSFFARDVLEVAPALLGARLTHAGVTVRVTETEAYAGHLADPGSHAYRGETPRTAPMFGPAGFTYVYFTYGMHWMLCLVTGPAGLAQAVLVRAGEVVAGHDLAAARRPGVRPRDWCRGPARLAASLALTGQHTGLDFCRPSPRAPTGATTGPGPAGRVALVARGSAQAVERSLIRSGPRVGVSGPGGDGTSYPWRFWIDGEATVSVFRPGVIRRRG